MTAPPQKQETLGVPDHPATMRLLVRRDPKAVFEATKSVADKIRTRTGLKNDGAQLVDDAFGMKQGMPALAFNLLLPPTEESEHQGLAMLVKGMFATFRNTTAHAPKISWPIGLEDALDLLTLASMLHRRIDAAHVTPAAPINQVSSAS
jgi:uncharacterized protein (TIGR02391 family)